MLRLVALWPRWAKIYTKGLSTTKAPMWVAFAQSMRLIPLWKSPGLRLVSRFSKNMNLMKKVMADMILGMSNADYHAHSAISSSDVKMVAAKSLAHWKHKVRKRSTAFDLGTAVHAMVLEPHLDLIVRGPEDRRGDKWKKAVLAADLDGKLVLTESDYDQAVAMADAVRAHPVVQKWMSLPFIAEASFFAEDSLTKTRIKCRPDGFIPSIGLVFDIKTTTDASPEGFPREVRKYGYDLQADFYLRTLQSAGYNADDFFFVCVEKEPPYAVCVHSLEHGYMRLAEFRVSAILEKISNAQATDDFTTGWPLINHIPLPRWQADEPEADAFDETTTDF